MGGAGQPNAVIQPVAVPTSTTNVGSASDACLISITITNKSGGSLSFSLCDRQGTPVCAVAAAPIAANTTYILVWPVGAMYWCPGGFTILASGTGLTIEGNFRQ